MVAAMQVADDSLAFPLPLFALCFDSIGGAFAC